MADAPECPWPHLLAPVLEELRRAPAGLSEFDLIRRLQARGDLPEFGPAALREPLSLYRTHFILFHCLHRLAAELAAEGEDIEAHCLRIRIVRRHAADAGAVGSADPLRAFYLDVRNLENVDASQVEAMLGRFWARLARDDRRAEALAVLGLEDPVSDGQIKARYRRLAMKHHPDRGGDKAVLQALNEAVGVLLG